VDQERLKLLRLWRNVEENEITIFANDGLYSDALDGRMSPCGSGAA
jgi:hypothetical protein